MDGTPTRQEIQEAGFDCQMNQTSTDKHMSIPFLPNCIK